MQVAEHQFGQSWRTDRVAKLRMPKANARELTREDWRKLVNRLTRHYFGMDADEFSHALKAGEFGNPEDPERPEVMRIAMLLPNGR